MAQLFSLGHIRTMTKTRRIILVVTNIVMLVASLVALLGFFGLTHQHSTYGFSGYPSRAELLASTNVASLQTMGGVAAWNWDRFTLVIDEARWILLASDFP